MLAHNLGGIRTPEKYGNSVSVLEPAKINQTKRLASGSGMYYYVQRLENLKFKLNILPHNLYHCLA